MISSCPPSPVRVRMHARAPAAVAAAALAVPAARYVARSTLRDSSETISLRLTVSVRSTVKAVPSSSTSETTCRSDHEREVARAIQGAIATPRAKRPSLGNAGHEARRAES